MKFSENFLIGAGIQRTILNKFGVVTATGESWNLQEFCDSIKKDPGVANKFDIYRLTDEEMAMLGFAPTGDGRNLRLIPSWLYQFLPDQLCVYGKDRDEPGLIKKQDIGLPVAGFFGVAVKPADKNLRDEQVVVPKQEVVVPKEN